MANSPASKIVERLRDTISRLDEDRISDGVLLERYIEMRDEAAFAALVRRHGSMVWGVCRRIVGHTEGAEDAFQAAFLILVRKANSIKPRDAVGNWLYGVARHAALKARTASARAQRKEKQVATMPESAREQPEDREELHRLLDQALNALPDKYRVPVILCDLEGRTRKEVAAQLRVPEGTLSSRLTTAHQKLAKRLAQHGLTVSGVAALLAENAASAQVPASVVSCTIKTAAIVAASNGTIAGVASTNVAVLTESVMKAMLLSKLKVLAVVVLLGSVFAVGGTYYGGKWEPAAMSQAPNQKGLPQAAPAAKPPAETIALMRLLEQTIETKNLHDKVKFKTALEFLSSNFKEGLPILVDRQRFADDLGPDAPDPFEEEVSLPPVPAKMTTELALRLLVSQIGRGQATFVLHRDWIEVTTPGASRTANQIHRPSIVAAFDQRPLASVLQELSDKAGVTINVDPQANTATPISATFRNSSLEEALVTVTEMGNLKYVVLDRSIFVTTPERAKSIQQEENERQKKRPPATRMIEAAA